MTNLVLTAIYYALYIMQMLLFLRVILSWFRLNPNNVLIELLYTLTEPILAPIRKLIDASIFGGRKGGMILDISPLIAFIFLQLMQSYVLRFIR